MQYHPYKQLVLHIDFQRVDAKTKLHMKVPVHYSGSEESAAVKIDKCMVNPLVTELDVACMPSDLPEFIAVDLSGLKKGFSCTSRTSSCPGRERRHARFAEQPDPGGRGAASR